MKIPLPKLMRHWREREFERHLSPRAARWGLAAWAFAARRPVLYRALSATTARVLGWAGGRARAVPRAAAGGGWTDGRDMPAPEGKSFMALWAERQEP